MRSSTGATLLFTLIPFLSALIVTSTDLGFTCSGKATCKGLVQYVSRNTTTLAHIISHFSVENYYDLVGANSYPLSTKSSKIINATERINIPFPCKCSNGSGISDNLPIYTVQPGDGLYHIAIGVYSGLVTYKQIARVNNIVNVNLIEIGQKLWIPLPCSCDEVNGAKVVHYGHIVVEGSTVEQIAKEYGTDQNTLLKLNQMANPNQLVAEQVFDVPLKVCSSSVNQSSEDYPMLVANGTYALTANNCVKCSCHSIKNYTLHCNPSGVKASNVTKCSSMLCEDGSSIGNTTTCGTCSYAGFMKSTIFTTTDNLTCSKAEAPPPPGKSASTRIGSQGSIWRVFLVTIHLGLLCFGLLW